MKQDIIIIGAGGHSKVCIELLRAMGEPLGYCIGRASDGADCLGVPVLAGDEHLARLRTLGYSRVFVAIGANSLRLRMGEAARVLGYELVNAISPHAVVSPSVRLGKGIAIMAGAVLNADTTIGDLAIINTGATVDHDCMIGTAVHIAPQCALAGNVTVGNGSFLGIGCKVVPEMTIGSQVMLGAGAVVIKAILDGQTAVGVPARVLSR
jgi:UDP-perosamine 4-acetyltransferase